MDLIPEGYAIVPLGPECVELPHGMVCYSGLLPGGTAVYTCREEYTLHGNDSRMCGVDSVWSGAVPQCDTDTNTTVTTTIQSHTTGEVMIFVTAYGCRCIKVSKFNISTTQCQIPYAGSVSKDVCEGVTLPIMTLIATSIPSCIAVCLFSCLSGALLYRILSTHCSKRRPEHKPQHYYDTVTLAADSVPSPLQGRTSAGGKNIITTPNQAYDEVILASVPRPLQGSTLADKSNYSK